MRSARREWWKKLGRGKACDLKLREGRLADTAWNQSKQSMSLECAKNARDFGILSKKTMFLAMEGSLEPPPRDHECQECNATCGECALPRAEFLAFLVLAYIPNIYQNVFVD